MITIQFNATFKFNSDDPALTEVLHHMKDLIFLKKLMSPMHRPFCTYNTKLAKLNKPVYYWKVDDKEAD